MTKSEALFHDIAADLPGMKESKMFGALCIKAPNGKAGVMFWRDEIVLKLEGELLAEALALKGAHLFEPMKGRTMGGWVQLSSAHSARWKKYAEVAMANVKKIKK